RRTRITPGRGGVTLHLGPRHRLDAELLAGPLERLAGEEVRQTQRRAEDVEVALVEDDAARQARARVDADAENQAAAPRLLDLDEDVLDLARVVGVDHGHDRPNSLRRVDDEEPEPGQVLLRDVQIRIAEDSARIQRNVPEDDVVGRVLVAGDDDLADA